MPRDREPGTVCANTMYWSAVGAHEIHVFWPFST